MSDSTLHFTTGSLYSAGSGPIGLIFTFVKTSQQKRKQHHLTHIQKIPATISSWTTGTHIYLGTLAYRHQLDKHT